MLARTVYMAQSESITNGFPFFQVHQCSSLDLLNLYRIDENIFKQIVGESGDTRQGSSRKIGACENDLNNAIQAELKRMYHGK